MTLKGSYRLLYTSEKESLEIYVTVELKMVEGMLQPRQNLYYGVATVNGKTYTDERLKGCVNAKLMAESIGKKLKKDAMLKCREEKKLFSIKKEEVK